MRIPTSDSINRVINEINEVDYTDQKQGIKSDVKFCDSRPVKGFDRMILNNVMKSNYMVPSKRLQEAYTLAFRSFSSSNKDSFENLV